jgi:hypothetical protein
LLSSPRAAAATAEKAFSVLALPFVLDLGGPQEGGTPTRKTLDRTEVVRALMEALS